MFDPTALSVDVKRALVILAVGHLAFVAIGVGASSLEAGSLDVDVEVVGVGTSNGGNVTVVHLQVTNNEPHPIDPVVRVPSSSWNVRNAWTLRGGPDVLAPNETATYAAVAPGERAEIVPPAQAVIVVTNASTQQRTAVGPVRLTNQTQGGESGG